MGSSRTTMALLALVIGMNTAYILRGDNYYAKVLALAILALIATAAIIAAQRSRAPGNPQEDRARRQARYFDNIILAFLASVSAWGIFG